MNYLLNVANERPMLRISATIILAFACAADRIVIFWLGGLRRALAHSLKSVRTEISSH
jgi:hypothetical protein